MNIKKLNYQISEIQSGSAPRPAVHALPVPACLFDPWADRVLEANAGFDALFAHQKCPQTLSACFSGQRPALISFTQAILALGGAETADLKPRTQDADGLDALIRGAVIHDAASPCCLLIVLPTRDVLRAQLQKHADESVRAGLLEWRRLETLYQQAESLNELILNAAGDGIFGIDRQGQTTFMNPAAARTLGFTEADLIGQNMHHLIHHHHADGRLYPADTCPIYQTLKHGQRITVDHEVFWHKSGAAVPVEYIATPILDSDRIEGAVIVFRDITERLESKRALEDALRTVDSYKQRLEHENAYLRDEVRTAWNHSIIIGQSQATLALLEQIAIVAPTAANVLITGESGTGKELVAQAIHDASARKDGPLIKVNCAAIPKDLFESEFFGHVKGAFSGATAHRVGRFELADGGTLFLDEVGEIPIDLQGKLLRALQEQKYERVGEGITRRTNVRIVAATNRNLRQAAQQGLFREDLYFRLDVFPIHCRPLRERLEDIPSLARHFIQHACSRFNLPTPSLSDDTVRTLQHYPWPGNARELQNVMERAVILAQGGRIRVDLPANESQPVSDCPIPPVFTTQARTAIASLEDIAALERTLILETVEACQGRISGPLGAARRLGIPAQTLYSRLKKYQKDPAFDQTAPTWRGKRFT